MKTCHLYNVNVSRGHTQGKVPGVLEPPFSRKNADLRTESSQKNQEGVDYFNAKTRNGKLALFYVINTSL